MENRSQAFFHSDWLLGSSWLPSALRFCPFPLQSDRSWNLWGCPRCHHFQPLYIPPAIFNQVCTRDRCHARDQLHWCPLELENWTNTADLVPFGSYCLLGLLLRRHYRPSNRLSAFLCLDAKLAGVQWLSLLPYLGLLLLSPVVWDCQCTLTYLFRIFLQPVLPTFWSKDRDQLLNQPNLQLHQPQITHSQMHRGHLLLPCRPFQDEVAGKKQIGTCSGIVEHYWQHYKNFWTSWEVSAYNPQLLLILNIS